MVLAEAAAAVELIKILLQSLGQRQLCRLPSPVKMLSGWDKFISGGALPQFWIKVHWQ